MLQLCVRRMASRIAPEQGLPGRLDDPAALTLLESRIMSSTSKNYPPRRFAELY